ncbi:MAG: hypothetical protein ACHQD7_15195, partial [Chitinophagales bacterium]
MKFPCLTLKIIIAFMISGPASKKIFQKFIVVIFLLSCGQAFAQPAALYVSPAGKNENPGTIDRPLKTIQAALSKVAALKENKINIYLRAGVYEPEKTIAVTPALLAEHEVSISSYRQEQAIISGSRRFRPTWRPWKNRILVT